MQQVELYRNGNETATQYPMCDIDWSVVLATQTAYGGAVAYDYITETRLGVIHATGTGNPFGDGVITDPRSPDQAVYFSADTVPGTFGDVINLTDQPDDFFVSGTGDTAAQISIRYYDVTPGSTAHATYYNGRTAFVPGAYYRCDSVSAMFRTVNGYYFGLSILDGFFPGSAWYNWFIKFFDRYDADSIAGTTNYWILQPQYNYTTSPQYFAPLSNIYDIFPRSSDPNDQASPTDITVFFGYTRITDTTWLLNDHPCVCICVAKQTDGQITNYDIVAIPVEMFGGVTPIGPTPVPVPEPGEFGPKSETGGGSGTYTDTSDPITIQEPVSLIGGQLEAAHGIHVYRINTTDYRLMMSSLWGLGTSIGDTLWTRYQNYKMTPISGILANHYIPYALVAAPQPIVTTTIRVAGSVIADTEAQDLSTDYIGTHTLDTLAVPEYFGSDLDYAPHTEMRLYLPFCGWIDIDPSAVVGGSIKVRYMCDNITGNITAYVLCTDRNGVESSLYTATGNCAVSMPVVGNDQGFGTMLTAAGSAALSAATGNIMGVAGSAMQALGARHQTQQTGAYGGSYAYTADKQCRLQIIRPVPSTPDHGQQLRGRPSDIGCMIGDLIGTGWTSFSAVHGDIPGATAEEQQAIIDMLHDGVIL